MAKIFEELAGHLLLTGTIVALGRGLSGARLRTPASKDARLSHETRGGGLFCDTGTGKGGGC